jgi:hypothetical protein
MFPYALSEYGKRSLVVRFRSGEMEIIVIGAMLNVRRKRHGRCLWLQTYSPALTPGSLTLYRSRE